MGDPSKAASKATQCLALAVMVVLYAVYVLAIGTGGLLVIPVGAFLLAAAGYLAWGWWSSRAEKPSGSENRL